MTEQQNHVEEIVVKGSRNSGNHDVAEQQDYREVLANAMLEGMKNLRRANAPRIAAAGPIPTNRRGKFKQNARRQKGRKVL